MNIYVLTEDTKKDEKFDAEHGLSLYFEKDNKNFLFDTGQSDLFLKNANKLGIDLSKIDYLIFSHGHYDHTGGLTYLQLNGKVKIIAHPYCLCPKYYGKRYIGFPKHNSELVMLLKEKPAALTKNVHFLGQIPGERRSSLGCYVKDNVKYTDFLLDDSAMAIIENDKLIILSGCAHSGIVNIVKYAKELFNQKEIAVIGGFHMLNYSDKEINSIINELKRLGVIKIYPGHCTGQKAVEKLLNSFDGEGLYSGKVIQI